MNKYIKKEKQFSPSYYDPLKIVLTKGQGCYLWDDKGRKYLDMMSAYSAVSHGHCNKELVNTLIKQSKTLNVASRAYFGSVLPGMLEAVCKISGLDKAIPMNTGAEAVETAVKAARLWGYTVKGIKKNKAEIIVAKNNFHGRTTTIISFSSEESYKDKFGPHTPGFKFVDFNNSPALEAAITPNTCAFIVEPIQGEAGIIVPDKGYLKEIQKICKKHNILLILDEVQSGLGRTGKNFAFQHEIDRPDGLILGKALGGGLLPVSCFVATNDVMKNFFKGSHGSTFGGYSLAAAVAKKALQILVRDKLAARSATLGDYLQVELKKIKSPLIKDVRGKGLWVGVELDIKLVTAIDFCYRLIDKGVLSKDTHGTVVRLAPPLVITKKQINQAIKAIKAVIKDVEKELNL